MIVSRLRDSITQTWFGPNCRGCLALSSIKSHLPSEVIFHHGLSSIGGCLPLEIVSNWRLSSICGHSTIVGQLPSEDVINPRSSSIRGWVLAKVVLYQMLSSIQGLLSSCKWWCHKLNFTVQPKYDFKIFWKPWWLYSILYIIIDKHNKYNCAQ